MVEDVLAALSEAPLAGVMVNTIDPLAAELARRYGARVVTDGARDGHTGAVSAMARILAIEGHDMLTVPGDIPRVTASEIAAVVAARRPLPSLTIVPAHDRRGVERDAAVAAAGDAAEVRRRQLPATSRHGARAGIEPTVVELPGIGLDIDQPEDLQALLAAEPPMPSHTNTFLRSLRP